MGWLSDYAYARNLPMNKYIYDIAEVSDMGLLEILNDTDGIWEFLALLRTYEGVDGVQYFLVLIRKQNDLPSLPS